MKPANRVVYNTFIQYARVFVTMGISLYTVRLVLSALGVVDFGIFNLIAGVISLFTFFSAAMSSSTQRFLSYYQGKEDIKMQEKIFSNIFLLHLVAAVLVFMILEAGNAFLFNKFLVIPAERVNAAILLYHCMCLTIFISIVSMPFTTLLIAHENMFWVALFNTIDIILKFIVAVLLSGLTVDKLVFYGIFTTAIAVVGFICIAFYCMKKYKDCKIRNFSGSDLPLIKDITTYTGWNLFGALCASGRYEGLAILFNLFFGAVINSAFGIAGQVAAQLSFFSRNMLRAIQPQIIKSESAVNRPRMLRLSMIASKFSFFLLAFFAIPCIFEMQAILRFWLKNVPDNTVVFCRLILLGTLANQLTIGLEAALQATGKIKMYQLVVGILLLSNIPLAYVLLKLSYPAFTVLAAYAVIELIACIARLYFAKKLTGLSVRDYLDKVIVKEIIPVLLATGVCFLITGYTHFNYRFVLTGMASASVFSAGFYFYGLTIEERNLLRQIFNTFITNLKNNLWN